MRDIFILVVVYGVVQPLDFDAGTWKPPDLLPEEVVDIDGDGILSADEMQAQVTHA
eukprot:COSAG05_NODE_2275_length_3297_cov_87.259225_1_plen_56_part_00